MDKNAELLFDYLRAVIYDPANAKLDIKKLDDEFRTLGSGLLYFAGSVLEASQLASALARGDLSAKLPSPDNELAAPLKSLHASLKHLAWQTRQVALGDYGQTVDFMGEFAESFNSMVAQLDSRQKSLMIEIEASRKKTQALEQSNSLLINIAANIPERIVVIENETDDILFLNNAMKLELDRTPNILDDLLPQIEENADDLLAGRSVEYAHECNAVTRYFSVSAYALQWVEADSRAYILNDISDQKAHLQQLEQYAYRDELTKLHNRFSGMQALNAWLREKKVFALCFIDMNNLKFVNDNYGHNEGDFYIRSVADNLNAFSGDSIVCRTGGDEFMILAENYSKEEAAARMEEVGAAIEAAGSLAEKEYTFSVSYGVVGVLADNKFPASTLLSIADERMYSHKRRLKAMRPT